MLADAPGRRTQREELKTLVSGSSILLLASTHGRAEVHFSHVAGGGRYGDRLLPEERRPPEYLPRSANTRAERALRLPGCIPWLRTADDQSAALDRANHVGA